jgi:hypothetical protein
MDDTHAMISNYSMNSCERNAIDAHLYAYIAGNITREVKNGNMDHYLPVWHDDAGCEDRQQGTCGNVTENGVTGDAVLLLNHVGYPGILGEPYPVR